MRILHIGVSAQCTHFLYLLFSQHAYYATYLCNRSCIHDILNNRRMERYGEHANLFFLCAQCQYQPEQLPQLSPIPTNHQLTEAVPCCWCSVSCLCQMHPIVLLDTVVFLAVLFCLDGGCIMPLEAVSYHLETQVNHLAPVSNSSYYCSLILSHCQDSKLTKASCWTHHPLLTVSILTGSGLEEEDDSITMSVLAHHQCHTIQLWIML